MNFVRYSRFATSGGMVPESRLSDTSNSYSPKSLAIDVGMGPRNPGLLRRALFRAVKTDRPAILPIFSGIVPSNTAQRWSG